MGTRGAWPSPGGCLPALHREGVRADDRRRYRRPGRCDRAHVLSVLRDRREVFFDGSQEFQDFLVNAVETAPAEAGPLDAVTGALCRAATEVLAGRSAMARRRQRLIDANPELQERECAKMSRLATALAGALRSRGVDETAASVAAETGIALFRVAFARWVEEHNTTRLEDLITLALDQLCGIAPRR